MKYQGSMNLIFNPKLSTIMHIDLNSCFATIEQQANPHLRGKPVAVAAYTTPNGCIIAPSIEAKKLGIKVGMRVKDGKLFCPNLIVLSPDPWKYRNIHISLRKLLSEYTNDFYPKSIDEFVLNLENFPVLKIKTIEKVAAEIKSRIKKEIGDWLTVSIGIAPNRFLAKTAAGLHKPDGLDEINKDNYLETYSKLALTDLCGIKQRNAIRLNQFGVYSVLNFFDSEVRTLRAAFGSVVGYYWYLRLRGWEIDDVEFGRRSYGNSYALSKSMAGLEELSPILSKLVEKMGSRLRKAGFMARGVHLAVSYRDGGFWHKGVSFPWDLFDSRDIYKKALAILREAPYKKPVRNLAVSVFELRERKKLQLELFSDTLRKKDLVEAMDAINERFGNFVITPGRMFLADKTSVPDRIAFGQLAEVEPQALLSGGIKELEEFALRD